MNWSLYVAVLKRENQRRKVGCFVGVLENKASHRFQAICDLFILP